MKKYILDIINQKSAYIMLIGLPCSGKSTFIGQLIQKEPNFIIASTDDLIQELAKDFGITYNEMFSKVEFSKIEAMMKRNIGKAINNKKSIIHDQTNLTPFSRKKKIALIPEDYYKVAVCFNTSWQNITDRNNNREGKFIPIEVMQKMYNNLAFPTKAEGFDEVLTIT